MELPDRELITATVARALAEDRATEDITAQLTVAGHTGAANFVARRDGVICGLPCVAEVYRQLGGVTLTPCVADGDRVSAGTVLAAARGDLVALLAGERTALNFLTHLSGIATLTEQFVAAVQGTAAGIYDTRKTIPGLRQLAKYAVRCGGGRNHRMDLAALALVKDNHAAACGSPAAAAAAVKPRLAPGVLLQVEIDALADLEPVIAAGADLVLLDNMTPAQVRAAVAAARGRVELEVSGGVNLATVRAYAAAGAQRISIGALTHSAPQLDCALDFA